MNSLNQLTDSLCEHLKKGKPLLEFKEQLQSYKAHDWQHYIKFGDCCYHREIVYQCEQFDLVVISWLANQASQIHDHPDQGCLMTVLQGQLIETLFTSDPSHPESTTVKYLDTRILRVGDIGYKEGKSCVHRIEAPIDSISLHIYSPSKYQAKLYNCFGIGESKCCGSD